MQSTAVVQKKESHGELVIKAEGGADPEEYVDLYGDFDVVPEDEEKSGRGFFGSSSSAASGCSFFFNCKSQNASAPASTAATESGTFFGKAGTFFRSKKVTLFRLTS